jgi:hypothetical protein
LEGEREQRLVQLERNFQAFKLSRFNLAGYGRFISAGKIAFGKHSMFSLE